MIAWTRLPRQRASTSLSRRGPTQTNRSALLRVALAALWPCLLSGCERATQTLFPACVEPAVAPPPAVARTYYRDIKPLVDARCAGCHVAGGIGPFPLGTYADVALRKDAIKDAVVSGHMPPWLPDRCCAEYRDAPALTPDQIAILAQWVDQGAPAGPVESAPPLPRTGLSRVDLSLSVPEPYVVEPPPGFIDEHRCFVLDWPKSTRQYVTGVNVKPGNHALVHHVILYISDGSDPAELARLEGLDPKPGFDCRGGLLGAKVIGAIGGWQPGGAGTDFPDGLGTRMEPGSKIILNIHYSLAQGGSGSDQTTLELKLDDAAKEMRGGAVGNLLWLYGDGMRLPAGEQKVYATEVEPTSVFSGGKPFDAYNVNVHMHQWATRALVTLERSDGTRECWLQISRWDMGWQGYFWFTQPKRVNPGDRLHLECHFDLSGASLHHGGAPSEEDLVWANDGEMCAGFFSLVEAAP